MRLDRARTMSRLLVVIATVLAAGLVTGAARAQPPERPASGQAGGDRRDLSGTARAWTTVFKSPLGLEGLTADDHGDLYSAGRAAAGERCPVDRVSREGSGAVVVGFLPAPCSPSGLTFDAAGRLYVTGLGADGDRIGVLTPSAAEPPTATVFATGVPGANGVAFDRSGNLWASDGTTAQGRVWRIGPQGGEGTEVFRIPAMTNEAGVGRDALSVPPGRSQPIVANGLAFTRSGSLLVADTARGAIWKVDLTASGRLRSPAGCDPTYPADTICLDDLYVQHPALEGADGIVLDRAGDVWAASNERNAIVVVTPRRQVSEFFRDAPVGTPPRRNEGPLEFPTSPFLVGRSLCVTQSDGDRRDNSPNSGGEVGPGTGFAAKISCLDQRLDVPGLPLPVR